MGIPRFSLRALMLIVTFASIALGSLFPLFNIYKGSDPAAFWTIAAFEIPPVVSSGFAGYAIARRSLTVRMLIALVIAQGIALGIAACAIFLLEPQ